MRCARLVFLGFALSGSALAVSGCAIMPPPSERATDAARDLNLAARFGRMDVALGLTTDRVRKSFLEHRAAWGKEVRIYDVELTGFSMPSREHAEVEVDYAWALMSDQQLHSTRVAQEWRDNGGGFRLVREHRASGDVGLFGEAMPVAEAAPARDVQFATKVIQ